MASKGFLGVVAFFLRRLDDRWCRIACLGAIAWMGDCFREMSFDEQIFVVLHLGSVNGGRIGSRSSVFLFKKYKHGSVIELCITLVRCNQVCI